MSEQSVDEQVQELEDTSAQPKQWTFMHPSGQEISYTQKKLSFKRKWQFVALVGGFVREVSEVGGQGAITDLLGGQSVKTRAQQLSSNDMADAESFLKLASSFALFLPSFMDNFIATALNVPLEDREIFAEATDDMEDEVGLGILRLFVEQNWETLRDFFVSGLPGVWKAVSDRMTTEEAETTPEEGAQPAE